MDLACAVNGHKALCWNLEVCSLHYRTEPHCSYCKEVLTIEQMVDLAIKTYTDVQRK